MPIFSLEQRRVEFRGEHHYIAYDATLAGAIVLDNEVNVWFGVMQPQRFLRDGDRVRCEVEGLGAIENVVRAQ